jgi:ubiquinone biosynthesis protein COQ4
MSSAFGSDPTLASRSSSPCDASTTAPRVRPWLALRALASASRDPENTAAGARFVFALQGKATERLFQRFRADPGGARILAERRSLRATLRDRAKLRALPEGSLGRTYAAFMDEEQISNEGLVDVTADAARELLGPMDADRRLVHDRITDLHDLWHVATGYSRDMLGELALIGFGYEQLGTPAYRVILAFTRPLLGFQIPGSRAFVDDARRRGREARWLPVQDWEGLLALPLDAAREELGLGPPPVYTRYFRVGRRLRPEGWSQAA